MRELIRIRRRKLYREASLKGMKNVFLVRYFTDRCCWCLLLFGVYRNLFSRNQYWKWQLWWVSEWLCDKEIQYWFVESRECFDVRFVESGNFHCFANSHQNLCTIEVSSSKVTHWQYIVETSSGAQFSGNMHPEIFLCPHWVFVDVRCQEKRDSSYPFYSLEKVFRDNPKQFLFYIT